MQQGFRVKPGFRMQQGFWHSRIVGDQGFWAEQDLLVQQCFWVTAEFLGAAVLLGGASGITASV
ncbi:MAG: hypothetical protein NVS1B11_24110 [Terriglobales bacterium]